MVNYGELDDVTGGGFLLGIVEGNETSSGICKPFILDALEIEEVFLGFGFDIIEHKNNEG